VVEELLALDRQLARQERDLEQQLQTLQQHRHSLQKAIQALRLLGEALPLGNPSPFPSPKPVAKPTPPRQRESALGQREPRWQRYLKAPYQGKSLGEVVEMVLVGHPDRGFQIGEIVDMVFEGLPLSASMTAHDRIAHLLAEGVKQGQWYRPKPGYYGYRSPG